MKRLLALLLAITLAVNILPVGLAEGMPETVDETVVLETEPVTATEPTAEEEPDVPVPEEPASTEPEESTLPAEEELPEETAVSEPEEATEEISMDTVPEETENAEEPAAPYADWTGEELLAEYLHLMEAEDDEALDAFLALLTAEQTEQLFVLLDAMIVDAPKALSTGVAASGTLGTANWSLDDTGTLTIGGTGSVGNFSTAPWAAYQSQINSVAVSSGITVIARGCFSGLNYVNSVTIPETVSYIGAGAFEGMERLNTLNISGISAWALIDFADCTANPVYVGRSYGNHVAVLLNGEPVTDLVLPADAARIRDYAFLGWQDLTSVTLPAGMSVVGTDAFADCPNIRALYLDSIASYLNIVFSNAAARPLYGSSQLSYIYVGGQQLKELAIPEGTAYIPEGAFSGWNTVTSVTIPAGVTEIGTDAFRGCRVSSLYLEDLAGWLTASIADGGAPFASAGTEAVAAHKVYVGGKLLTELTVPAAVTAIAPRACQGWNGLTGVRLHSGVRSIGQDAFAGCSNITALHLDSIDTYLNIQTSGGAGPLSALRLGQQTSVLVNNKPVTDLVIPDGITAIGAGLFSGWTGLASVTIPEGVTEIGGDAFRGCTGLQTVSLPSTLTAIGNEAFSGCTSLKTLTLPVRMSTIGEGAFSGASMLESVRIPAGIGAVSSRAFSGCRMLSDLEIPEGITEIGDSAFEDCASLSEVRLPATLTGIGPGAFRNAYALAEITIPAAVRTIGAEAFRDCGTLRQIHFSGEAPTIAADAFTGVTADAVRPADADGWQSVENQNYGGTLTWSAAAHGSSGQGIEYVLENGSLVFTGSGTLPGDWMSTTSISRSDILTVELGTGITAIGDGAFRKCPNLTAVKLPDSLETIGTCAFMECEVLSAVNMPANLLEIGDGAFGLTALTEVTFPGVLAKIGADAFNNCADLRHITLNSGLTEIGAYAFAPSGLDSVVIPASVTRIGASAFAEVRSVRFLGAIPTLGANAFRDALMGIYIPGTANPYTTAVSSAAPNAQWYAVQSDGNLAAGETPAGQTWALDSQNTLHVGLKAGGSGVLADCSASAAPWAGAAAMAQRLQIGDGITSIGVNNFFQGTFRDAALPKTLTSIGDRAFADCTQLTHIVVPLDVKQFGTGVFRGVPLKTADYWGSGADYEFGWTDGIPARALSGLEQLESVAVPDYLTFIGEDAFAGSSALRFARLGRGVQSIAAGAFAGQTNLELWFNGPRPDIAATAFRGSTIRAYYNPQQEGWQPETLGKFGAVSIEWIPSGHTSVQGYLGGLRWVHYEDGTLEISGGDIPAGLSETARWIDLKARVLSIGADVTAIGSAAFRNLDVTESVFFAGGAPTIAEDAFTGVEAEAWVSCRNLADGWAAVMSRSYGGKLVWKILHEDCGHTAADGVVTNIEIQNPTGKTNLLPGETLQLTAAVYPADAASPIVWSVSSETAATIDENGLLTAMSPGTVTVYAAAQDVLGVTASLELTVQDYYIAYLGADVISGGYQLKARLMPDNLTNTKIIWAAEPGGESFASVSAAGKVKMKAITEPQTIRVTASTADGKAAPCTVELPLTPKASEVRIYTDAGDVTGQTIEVDVNSGLPGITFGAYTLPEGADSSVRWTTSDGKNTYAGYAPLADGRYLMAAPHLASSKAATVTLTAQATDGSGEKASVKVKLVGRLQKDEFTVDGLEDNGWDNPLTLRGGASYTFGITRNPRGILTDKTITWRLADTAYSAYASVSAKGKLTTKPVGEPKILELEVLPASNPDAVRSIAVILLPEAQKLTIQSADAVTIGKSLYLPDGKDTIHLSNTVYPADALQDGIWKSSWPAVASINEKGELTFHQNGAVTITCKAADDSGVSASIRVYNNVPVTKVTVNPIKELTPGAKAKLKATVNADATDKAVVWEVDPEYLTLDGNTIVANTVYRTVKTTVRAYPSDDYSRQKGVKGEYTVTIQPKDNVMGVSLSSKVATAELINGKTISVDSSQKPLKVYAALSSTWSSSKTSVATVKDGTITILKPGTTTITATSKTGGKTGKFTLTVSTLMTGFTIVPKTPGSTNVLTSGAGTLQLAVEPENTPTSAAVKWSTENPELVTVSSAGLVTAKAGVFANTTATICARAKDGGGAEAKYTVQIIPAATVVHIFSGETLLHTADGQEIWKDEFLDRRTLQVDIDTLSSLQLGAAVFPNVGDQTAAQGIRWKSSNAAVAEVDETGSVRLKTPGTVTIKAIAADGSGEYAYFKLTLVRVVKRIAIDQPDGTVLGAGTKLKLTAALTTNSGAAPTDKGVQYVISPADSAYATVSSSGKVTAKKVTDAHEIEVTVISKANPDVTDSVRLVICPKVTKVAILLDGEPYSGKQTCAVGTALDLTAVCTPELSAQTVQWSVSSTSRASIDASGHFTALKPGAVTIKAAAIDGSGKSASIKMQITE